MVSCLLTRLSAQSLFLIVFPTSSLPDSFFLVPLNHLCHRWKWLSLCDRQSRRSCGIVRLSDQHLFEANAPPFLWSSSCFCHQSIIIIVIIFLWHSHHSFFFKTISLWSSYWTPYHCRSVQPTSQLPWAMLQSFCNHTCHHHLFFCHHRFIVIIIFAWIWIQ